MRYKKSLYKSFRRRFKKSTRRLSRILQKPGSVWFFVVLLGGALLSLLYMHEVPDIYVTGLLNTIARGESDYNYNAYYGHAQNSQIMFTSMPIKDVLAWQDQYVKQGSPSSAVGRYQFLDTTLAGLVRDMHMDENTPFDEVTQDKLATALLDRRGLRAYVNGQLSQAQFAYNLSQEWASLPKALGANPEQSYYATDGLNKAQLSLHDLYAAIATVHKL